LNSHNRKKKKRWYFIVRYASFWTTLYKKETNNICAII